MKRTIGILLFLCISLSALSQELEPMPIEELPNDLRARTEKRLDLNDNPCALIRVVIPQLQDLQFSGGMGVVGGVDYTPGEYLVYVPEGTRKLVISHPSIIPCVVNFEKGQIKGLVTYRLWLKLPETNANKTILCMKLNVPSAILKIGDSEFETDNAEFNVPLSAGEYDFKVSSKTPGFSPHSGHITIDKKDVVYNHPRIVLNTNETRSLTVYSDKNASVYIDGELQSKSGTFSVSLPAGIHTVEAKSGEGDRWYIKTTKDLSVKNDSVNVQLRGELCVDYPKDADFYIEALQGAFPVEKKSFKTGQHMKLLGTYKITAKKKNYSPSEVIVNVGVAENLPHYRIEMVSIADNLYYGLNGSKMDKEKAFKLYKKAAAANDDHALFQLGKIAMERNDRQSAIDYFKMAAEEGNREAMELLYTKFYEETGREYAEMAAEYGDAEAMVFLGDKAFNSSMKDLSDAYSWYMKAYQSGSKKVYSKLGDCFLNGWGTAEDYARAKALFMEGIANEDAISEERIADYSYYGLGGQLINKAEAIKIYQRLNELGLASKSAIYKLAVNEYRSKGNPVKAAELLYGIDVGYIKSQTELDANMVKEIASNCFKHYPSHAIRLYETSFDMGNTDPQSMINLGKLYYQGKGTPKNLEKAISLFIEAAKDAPQDAYHYLGICYTDRKDYDNALRCFRKAYELNNISSCVYLGRMFYYGQAVNKNEAVAVEFMIKAGKNGNQTAIKFLVDYYKAKKNKSEAEKWSSMLKN